MHRAYGKVQDVKQQKEENQSPAPADGPGRDRRRMWLLAGRIPHRTCLLAPIRELNRSHDVEHQCGDEDETSRPESAAGPVQKRAVRVDLTRALKHQEVRQYMSDEIRHPYDSGDGHDHLLAYRRGPEEPQSIHTGNPLTHPP